MSNFFAIFYQKKLLAGKTPKLQKLKKWRYWWFLLKIVLPSSKGLLLRLMYGLIFQLTSKTNFFYLWSSFGMKFSPKVKKQIFIRKLEFFNEKIFFDHFSNVHHSYTTFLDCYKVIHVANAAFIKDFFKISPGESKTWKKDFSATKSNKSTIWMLECRNWIPKLVYPLGRMGFSFSTLAFKLWICLILFRTCLPQIPIFGGIAKCNNSVSFTDRSKNFSPISL